MLEYIQNKPYMGKIYQHIHSIKSFIGRRPWTAAILAILIIGGGYWYYSNKTKQAVINSVTVSRGTVSQLVSVTGAVKPAQEVKLSFEKSGRIAAVYYDVGEQVQVGEALVSIDNADLSAQIAQARASVKGAQAKLEELKKGTRPEDISVSQVAVLNAESDAVNDVKNSYVNADDAIRNKVDQFISNPKSFLPQLNFMVTDSQLKSEVENGRPTMETILASWNSSLSGLPTTKDVTRYISEAESNLRLVQAYLDKTAMAVNALTTNSTITQTTIDSYKAAVLSGRTNVTNALDALTASEEKLKNAQSALALKKAGTVKEQIDAQEAAVEGAQANVMSLEAQFGKTVIRSPISGIVTKQDAKVGEIAPMSTPLTSIISGARYEIKANVPEADIAKIKIGNSAQATLDAYGSDFLFNATVTEIDPAETIVEGVSTYKTTLQFKENDTRIKSGMTANTDISGEKRENVLFIPGRAITTKGAVKTVNLIEGKTIREVVIITGLRGSNGDVEILSGLKEGDKVKVN